MKSTILSLLSGAVLLAQDAAAAPDFMSSKWVHRRQGGNNYACKCYPGDACWPNNSKWQQFNQTVGGRLSVHIPPGAVCYNKFVGPFGEVNTYNEAECQRVTANWYDEQFQVEFPAAGLWTYFTNDTCRPTTNPNDSCTLGYYGPVVLKAQNVDHITKGLKFAKQNNLRLVVRNTGHDFLGRSVGFGSFIINTHSLKDIKIHKKWTGGCGYTGPAVTLGAGVQAFEVLAKLRAQNPPKTMVTGECATVGVSGGLVQGGGHGPFTNFHGMLADTALEFKVITADGKLRVANPKTNSDLFWALKGGGPGNYGVIVEASFKIFDDKPSAGVNLEINLSGSSDPNAADLFWEGVRIFHSYSVQWVDAGLYVYYEIGTMGLNLRVHPFVGIGKTPQELATLLAPMFAQLDQAGVPYTTNNASFPTFYDLYNAMFEAEAAGNSALTGGWTLAKQDVQANPQGVIDAFKTVLGAGSFMVGHMWNAGRGLPQSEWGNSAVNPRFRHVVDKLITIVPVGGDAPLDVKAEAQNRLTNVVDAALRQASPNGCAYVNEADPFEPNWQEAFYGTNYQRLKNIKKKYDPEGLFWTISTPGSEEWEQIETGTRLCKVL